MGSGTGDEGHLHILMFPFPAFGHISPFLQLAHRLSSSAAAVTGGEVRITFLSAAGNVPRITALLPPSSAVTVVPINLPAVPGLPIGAESTADLPPADAELLKLAVDAARPDVAALLQILRPRLVVFDFGTQWLPAVAAPLGIKTLFFSVFAAVSTAFFTVPARRLLGPAPTLSQIQNPPPGFPPSASLRSVATFEAADFLYIFKKFDGNSPCVFDRVVACIESCDAIVAKTCNEMEGEYVRYVSSQFGKPMLLTGPLVPEVPAGELEAKWKDWLDGFTENSVIFSSFGSETFLTDDEAAELLIGLEMTGFPFFVVLNSPEGDKEGQEAGIKKRVPQGFEERVRDRGVVHSGWVQQQHILRHKSVGCFVCHAGLSSLVEGVVAGCQLVMLPLKGDQFLNAKLFAGDLGVGVEVERRDEDGRFTREVVCGAVRKVVAEDGEEEGKRVREKHRKWREFLTDGETQERFMVEFVEKLRELAVA